MRFLNEAQTFGGACRNRMDNTGHWTDEPSTGDHWGRCIWGLGTAAAHSDVSLVGRLAVIQLERAAQARSKSPRAMAFAALGAAELLAVNPDHRVARKLITDYAASVPAADQRSGVAVARATTGLRERRSPRGDDRGRCGAGRHRRLRQRGLDLLGWLVEFETADGHLSPTPVGGRGAEDAKPGFDQQPIEVATLADACARAAVVDAGAIWPDTVRAAAAWFMGDNDAGLAHVGSGNRWRIRRAARRRGER